MLGALILILMLVAIMWHLRKDKIASLKHRNVTICREVDGILDGLRKIDPSRSDSFLYEFLDEVQRQCCANNIITIQTKGLITAMNHGCCV